MSRNKILMIEDDLTFADIHVKAMRDQGFFVTHVTNGEDAMRKLEQDAPDIVLLDIGLPRKDGFTVLKEIRNHETGKEIPVMMLTRLSAKEDIDRAFQLGANEYLIKTQHSPEEVVRHVLKRLGREADRGD
jgi:DNA-binding response OmpR family regulator